MSASFYHIQQKRFGTKKYEKRTNQVERPMVVKWIPLTNKRVTVFIWHSAVIFYIQNVVIL